MNNELKDYWKDESRLKKVERELNKKVEIKKEVTLNFDNYKNSETNFSFKSRYNFEKVEKYSPKIFLFLIGYFVFMIGTDIVLETFFLTPLSYISFIILWLYSLISIIKNDFKKENQKLIWIILIIFVPFSALLYPDFRKVQIIKDQFSFGEQQYQGSD